MGTLAYNYGYISVYNSQLLSDHFRAAVDAHPDQLEALAKNFQYC